MENLAADLVALLWSLLPGFLAAWIFYGFTSYPKPPQFERIIQALIFTLIIQAVVYFIKALAGWAGNYLSFGKWTTASEMVASIGVATFIGFVFAYFANTDKFHALCRSIGVTRETSYPSEWFGVFSKNVTYVVLHLNDERRIYGWPIEWPSEPGQGHFCLQQVSWLDEDDEIPLAGVDSVLIKSEDVKWIEFMSKPWDKPDEQEIVESSSANTTTR